MNTTSDGPAVLSLPEMLLPCPTENAAASGMERRCIYTSEELLQGRREAWIEHNGELYRLRLTGSGKLYLTK